MHTNETVNYGLSQFIGTDIPNPLVDYNGDMEKIDTAIKNVADVAAGETTAIAALEAQNGNATLDTTAQTLSEAVNELKGVDDGLDTRLTTAEGKIITDESTLATAVSNISTLAGKVSDVETKVGSAVLVTTAQDLSGAVNELADEIGSSGSGLDARVTDLETQNGSDVLTTTAQTLSGAVNELNAKDAGDIEYDNTTSGLSATNVQGAIDEVNAKYSPTRTADVIITGNGVKTVAQCLTELADAVDFSKITPFSTMRLKWSGVVRDAVISSAIGNNYLNGSLVEGTVNVVECIVRVFQAFKTGAGTSHGVAFMLTGGATVTRIDDSSQVVANGDTFEFYY